MNPPVLLLSQRDTIKKTIKAWPGKVVLAAKASVAEKTIAARSGPWIVILDWRSLGSGSNDLCGRLRRLAKPSALYIVAALPQSNLDGLASAASAAVDDLLVLPLERDAVSVRLRVAERVLAIESSRSDLGSRICADDDDTRRFGRGALVNAIAAEASRAARTNSTFSILVCEIDQPLSGLRRLPALRTVVERLHTILRPYDVIARGTADSFVVLISGCDNLHTVGEIADRVRAAISDQPFDDVHLTASLGVTTFDLDFTKPLKEPAVNPSFFVDVAEHAFWRAKVRGGNQVIGSRWCARSGANDITSRLKFFGWPVQEVPD